MDQGSLRGFLETLKGSVLQFDFYLSILVYFYSKPMQTLFLAIFKKCLRPKWAIYKHISNKSKKCLSVILEFCLSSVIYHLQTASSIPQLMQRHVIFIKSQVYYSSYTRMCVQSIHTFWYINMPDVTASYETFFDFITVFGYFHTLLTTKLSLMVWMDQYRHTDISCTDVTASYGMSLNFITFFCEFCTQQTDDYSCLRCYESVQSKGWLRDARAVCLWWFFGRLFGVSLGRLWSVFRASLDVSMKTWGVLGRLGASQGILGRLCASL